MSSAGKRWREKKARQRQQNRRRRGSETRVVPFRTSERETAPVPARMSEKDRRELRRQRNLRYREKLRAKRASETRETGETLSPGPPVPSVNVPSSTSQKEESKDLSVRTEAFTGAEIRKGATMSDQQHSNPSAPGQATGDPPSVTASGRRITAVIFNRKGQPVGFAYELRKRPAAA